MENEKTKVLLEIFEMLDEKFAQCRDKQKVLFNTLDKESYESEKYRQADREWYKEQGRKELINEVQFKIVQMEDKKEGE